MVSPTLLTLAPTSFDLPEVLIGNTVFSVYCATGSHRNAMKQPKPLGFADLVEQWLNRDVETFTSTNEKAPTHRQLMPGDDFRIGDQPEKVRRSPFDQAVEFGVGMETSLDALDISKGSLVALMVGALEVDAVIFLEERVTVGDRWIVKSEFLLNAGATGIEDLEPV